MTGVKNYFNTFILQINKPRPRDKGLVKTTQFFSKLPAYENFF